LGSSVIALCECGFTATYGVGGAMRSHLTHSYFPYRCSPCGMISVNIAADEIVCPSNKAHKLTRIAGSWTERSEREKADQEKQSAIKPSFLEWIGLRKRKALSQPVCSSSVICQWGDHELYDQPYQCPYCRKVALCFTESRNRFD
jgi:hypothetical protein